MRNIVNFFRLNISERKGNTTPVWLVGSITLLIIFLAIWIAAFTGWIETGGQEIVDISDKLRTANN